MNKTVKFLTKTKHLLKSSTRFRESLRNGRKESTKGIFVNFLENAPLIMVYIDYNNSNLPKENLAAKPLLTGL